MIEAKVLRQDQMIIEVDAPFTLSDGTTLRCDIFRPEDESKTYPVIFSFGPYGKGLNLLNGLSYKAFWNRFITEDPTTVRQSSCKYQNWEVVDPELWTQQYGYACVRFDSRGAGSSEGYLEPMDLVQEAKDIRECMDWIGQKEWCNGRIGMSGISYYGVNQWFAASVCPSEYLKCICPYEAFIDQYRDMGRTGGILTKMGANWFTKQAIPMQHGLGVRGPRHMITGDLVCGDETWSDAQLQANRADMRQDELHHELVNCDYWQKKVADPSKIKIPMLSGANWSGAGVHPRGNYVGFDQGGSEKKWLEIHPWSHGTMYVNRYGNLLQKHFFDFYLKGIENGWEDMPRVFMWRRFADLPGQYDLTYEKDWPLPQTEWKTMYCGMDGKLSFDKPAKTGKIAFRAMGEGLSFITDPLEQDIELCGPMAAKMRIASSTTDADIFVVVRVLTADLHEVVTSGQDFHHPLANGWLRASHRKLDEARSTFYRPWHSHDEKQPLEPGKPYDLDIEIIPTGMVIPKGYRLAFTIRGKDYEYMLGTPGDEFAVFAEAMNGCGPAIHTETEDRVPEIYGGETTVFFDADNMPSILLPFIPREQYYPDSFTPRDKYYSHLK